MRNRLFILINYDKKYLKQIVELFTNTIHNINKKDYTKEQLNAWANPNYDLNIWDKRFEKSKLFFELINFTFDKIFKKLEIK
ncbi:hypothetical protein [Arcobacter aquimarinus]|uniref:hypothetical protein n=1 Tax=Arcobacter aquimarinus TaxID=1315211 RepID=UPI00100B6F6A|nr:hypothetical protein [Arcobacter aquimarinus]RXI35623.1 hypothetical protein CP986_05870 [Arcobacter aquimarinus]